MSAPILEALYPDLDSRDDARGRFLHEPGTAARVRHPHVVVIHDVGAFGDVPYLVVECLTGEDLAARIIRERTLPVVELVNIPRPRALSPGRRFPSVKALGRALLPLPSARVRVVGEGDFAVHPSALERRAALTLDEDVVPDPRLVAPRTGPNDKLVDAQCGRGATTLLERGVGWRLWLPGGGAGLAAVLLFWMLWRMT